LDGCFLILDVDRIGGYAMDNDSVGWHDELCVFSKAFDPAPVLFELCSLGSCTRENLDVTTFELVCRNNFDQFGSRIVTY
jgi:hypothetical protein